ncbi:MAG: TolC family protein [Candidatus Omnitrophica bacterium]|nr:TolC family protein [Candidatus Omnitrophota bacterium]
MKLIIIFFIALILTAAPNLTLAQEGKEPVIYLSMEDCVKKAACNNLDIRIARFDAMIKKTDLDYSKSIFDTILELDANYEADERMTSSTIAGTRGVTSNYDLGVSKKFPFGTDVELDFTNERDWNDSAFATINPAWDSGIRLTLTQPLAKNRVGLIDRGEIEITELDILNMDSSVLDRIEEAMASVQKSYWALVLAYKRLAIRKDMLEKAEGLFKLNKEKLKTGLVEETDLLASRANLEQRRADLLVSENEVETAINDLKLKLGDITINRIVPTQELLLDERELAVTPSMNRAIKYRRDYQRAKNDIKAKNIKTKIESNSRWPEIDLEGSFAINGVDKEFANALDRMSETNNRYYWGIKFTFPFENREAGSQYKKATFEKAKALVNLHRIERIIFTEIDEHVRNCNLNRNRVRKYLEVERLQGLKLEEEEKKFQYGRSDSDTVIRFQQHLFDARMQKLNALIDYKSSIIDLERAENSLLEEML